MKKELPVTSWKSDTAFELNPKIASGTGLQRFSNACLEKLNQLKERINREMSIRFAGTLSAEMIRHAINEADAIAASLPYPALLLPTLAEEKVLQAASWRTK